jgi:hypothetical protein
LYRRKIRRRQTFAQIFGLNYDGPMGHFAPVRVNDELTLDFDNAEFRTASLCVSGQR